MVEAGVREFGQYLVGLVEHWVAFIAGYIIRRASFDSSNVPCATTPGAGIKPPSPLSLDQDRPPD
ncbi:MAG: hypothetical protein ACRD19_16175, partial [Terriglobia bacterium]